MMMIKAAVAAAGEKGVLSRPRFFRSRNLMLLGLAVLYFWGAACNEEEEAVAHRTSSARQGGSNIGLLAADDYPSGFIRGKQDVGAPALLARMPGEGNYGSTATTAYRHLGGLDLIQGNNSQAVMIRKGEEESVRITKATLNKLRRVIVVQEEGIIYCPIAKDSSSEWKRTLRWMVGVESWGASDGKLASLKTNGLESLAARGLKETRWALQSDRFTRFVVVRDPGERLLSAFLGKCMHQGCERGFLSKHGAPNCPYLRVMPEMFPNTEEASLASHARLKELVEADPEDTFYHFAKGLWNEFEGPGDTCKTSDAHHRPQACFCDLPNLLPVFHVMPLSNLSAEADALVDRLPAALPDSGDGAELDVVEVGGLEGMAMESNRRTGVDEARREEIRAFITERFNEFYKIAPDPTHAHEHKSEFLSERVMELINKMYVDDYDLLGDYF